MQQRLGGTVAIVTGGSRGIGRAIALRLASEGADVAISYNTSPDRALDVVEDIRSIGREAMAMQCDVARSDQVRSFVDTVLESFGRLDILVNNAGITRDTLIMRMSEEDWDAVINTNLSGSFYFCRECVRAMKGNKRGKIINIGSIVAESGNPGQANYVASKAGLIGLSRALARELAVWNIQVNVVAPGFVETDMTAKLSDEQKMAILKAGARRGIAKPEKIASFVSFLASPESDLITGQTFVAEATHAQWEQELHFKPSTESAP